MQHALIEHRVAMEKNYHHLSVTDRVTLMFLKRQGLSLHAIASELNRSPSTLSRELRRRTVKGQPYNAEAAGLAARSARLLCRPRRKLVEALTSIGWSSTCCETSGLLSKSAAH